MDGVDGGWWMCGCVGAVGAVQVEGDGGVDNGL